MLRFQCASQSLRAVRPRQAFAWKPLGQLRSASLVTSFEASVGGFLGVFFFFPGVLFFWGGLEMDFLLGFL